MAFSWRRCVSLGPVRVNFSGSGVGYSFGARGARISTGPRGTYVHVGAYGFRYSQRLGSPRPADPRPRGSAAPPHTRPAAPGAGSRVERIEPSEIVNSSADDLLGEIRDKYGRVRLDALCSAVGLLLCALGGAGIAYGQGLLGWIPLGGGTLAIAATPWARWYDRRAGTVRICYILDPVGEKVEDGLRRMNEAMRRTHAIWSVTNEDRHGDWKRNAGATRSVERGPVRVGLGTPPRIVTNVSVGFLAVGGRQLYFFPDRLLIFSGRQVAAVPYHALAVRSSTIRFVEDGRVPPDATLVGHTWRYVNKDGGPDRRFSSNRRLPIALYGVVRLQAAGGLNLELQTSATAVAEDTEKLFSLIDRAARRIAAGRVAAPASLPVGAFPPDEPPPLAWLGRLISLRWVPDLPDWLQPVAWGGVAAVPLAMAGVRLVMGSGYAP